MQMYDTYTVYAHDIYMHMYDTYTKYAHDIHMLCMYTFKYRHIFIYYIEISCLLLLMLLSLPFKNK